jgi:hypothetical protein
MYSLSGYKDNGPGYQIKYDSQEDEWSLFTKAEHPNWDGSGTDTKTVARSGSYVVIDELVFHLPALVHHL